MARLRTFDIGRSAGSCLGGWVIVLAVLCGAAPGATLEELFDGGFLEANGVRFGSWQLLNLDSTASPAPDFSQIVVLPLVSDPANPGLHFAANGQLAAAGINAIDLHFKYRAQVLSGGNTLTSHTSSISGITFGSAGGIAFITDSMTTGLGTDLGSAVALADNETETYQFTHTTGVPPQSDIFVTTNVFLTGLATVDSVNLTSFTHLFAKTGPPVLAGDYNQNGVVDAPDYVIWRNNVGAPAGTLPNDISGGVISQPQYAVWRARFGSTSGSGAGAMIPTAVPEPGAGGMLLVLCGLWSLFNRRRA